MILFYHFLTVKKFIFPKKHIDFRQKTIAFAVFLKKCPKGTLKYPI